MAKKRKKNQGSAQKPASKPAEPVQEQHPESSETVPSENFLDELKQAALEAEPDDGWTTANSFTAAPKEKVPPKAPSVTDLPPREQSGPIPEHKVFTPNDMIDRAVSGGSRHEQLLSEEEKQRRAMALDALDRDLGEAHKKKMAEDAEQRAREEAAKRRAKEQAEKYRIAQIRKKEAEQRAIERRKEQERKEAEALDVGDELSRKTEGGAVSHGTKKARQNAVKRSFNSNLAGMNSVRVIILILLIIACLYGVAYIYSSRKAKVFYDDLGIKLTALNKAVTDESMPYVMPASAPMTEPQKSAYDLPLYLRDSDSDGLDDYFEIARDISPYKADTDGDSLPDGLEYKTGLDPTKSMSDGVNPDSKVIVNTTITGKTDLGTEVSVLLNDVSKAAHLSLTPAENYTLNGTPGILGTAYEFGCNMDYKDAVITFTYTDEAVAEKGYNSNNLAVFCYDTLRTTFEQMPSELDTANKTVSAHLESSGIYALFDSSIAGANGKTQVFFLFDNSGSMYPEALCKGSEENDVDFKRLDMALNLIDMLGAPVNFGAAEFSGKNSYHKVADISSDIQDVKAKIDDLRNHTFAFNGTEISEALENAIAEFGDIRKEDRNYIVLLTDGQPTTLDPAHDKAVIEEAQEKNITIFTIGLGKSITSEYLINFAISTNGQFFQATNADALENIYEKIKNFMTYNQVVVDDATGKTGFIVADSGFNIERDGFKYANFRSDFAPYGADPGIAWLVRDYYSGNLEIIGQPYRTADGRNINGYNLSENEALSDGKLNLNEVSVAILDKYNEYLLMNNKWDFTDVRSSVLRFNDKTRKFIESAGLRITMADYKFDPPELNSFDNFLASITGTTARAFTSYECVLIDSSLCKDADYEVMKMIQWYCELPNREDTDVKIYDFSYEGNESMSTLVDELKNGRPAVIAFGGHALNAIRITRDNENPDSYMVDAYDSNSPERAVKLRLERNIIFSSEDNEYQYIASKNGDIEPLRINVLN